MGKYARIDAQGVAIEVCDALALATHEPGLRVLFVPCPDTVVSGSMRTLGAWSPPVPVIEQIVYPSIEPPKFYWLFTAEEQLQIEALKISDPMLQLFFKRLDDPRLTGVDLNLQSVQDAIKYTLNKIHVGGYAGRFDEIMTGVLR